MVVQLGTFCGLQTKLGDPKTEEEMEMPVGCRKKQDFPQLGWPLELEQMWTLINRLALPNFTGIWY